MKRRWLIGVVMALWASGAQAQQPVTRIVVAFAPGGPVDIVARIISDRLGVELGTRVIVENKAGANGSIGAVAVKNAAPNGQTLWLTSVGAAAINQSLYPSMPYSMEKDFEPISVVVNNQELLVVSQHSPYVDAAAFFSAARSATQPLSMASSGIGSIPHLAIEQVSAKTGIKFVHVPFRGAAPAINDVAAGHVQGFFGDVAGLIGMVQSGGTLRPIGLAASKRNPLLPDVKTLGELGIGEIDTNNWYALYTTAGTPPDTIDKLNKAVRATLADDAIKSKLLSLGAEPAASTPGELAALQKHDAAKWGEVIAKGSIKDEQK